MGDTIDTRMSRRDYPSICENETENVYRLCPKTDLNTNSQNDHTKKKLKKTWPPKFKSRDLFFAFSGLILFISDLISDWRLAILYFMDNQMVEFYLTLGFILGPSLFSGVISIVWYTTDHMVVAEHQEQQQHPLGSGTGKKQHGGSDIIHPEDNSSQNSSRNDQSPTHVKIEKSNGSISSSVHRSDSDNQSDSYEEKENGHVDDQSHLSVKDDNKKNVDMDEKQLKNDVIDTTECGSNRTREIQNKKKFCLRIVMSCLQLGRIFRSIEYIGYILKSWRSHSSRQEHIRLKAIEQKQDAAILGLVDGFLESALQLVLQLYLSIAFSLEMDFFRVMTLLLSLGSTALTHTVYYRTNRKSKKWKVNVGYKASFIYFLWRICELSPRFLLLSLSIYCLFPWIFVAVMLHISIIFVSFCIQKPELIGLCPNRVFKTFFLLLLSYVALFCHVNVDEGKTRVRTVLYYILFYAENIAMATVIILICHQQSKPINYKWAYSSLAFVPALLLHILFQILYYKRCHPNVVS